MKESAIVAKILKYLRSNGFVAWKNHGGPFANAGRCDIDAVKEGRFYSFEVKRPGQKATALQLANIRKVREAGGVAGVVFSVEDVIKIVD